MFKKILRIFIAVLILMGVLWFGGTSISKFAHDIQFRNPVEVFDPLVQKLGIDLHFNVKPDPGGSVIVNADNTKPSTEPSQPEQPIIDDPTQPVEPTVPPVDDPSKPDTPVITLTVTAEDLTALINTIRVSDGEARAGYDRTAFESPGRSYTHTDGKKYNRHDYAWKTSSYTLSEEPFEYACPYTGLTVTDETKLDYDHIIALGYVYKYGNIEDWSAEKCNEYSYDQSIGVDVWYKSNRSKSDKGPADWLPDVNIEDYCYTWLCIASEWNIALRQEDINMCLLQCKNAISSGHNLVRID